MKRARKQTLKLFEVYNSLSDNQRSQFWSAAINVFLIIFTFWLGLTVQLIVVDTNKSYNEKLIKMQYQEKLSEDRHKLNIVKAMRRECDLIQEEDSREDIIQNYALFRKNVCEYYTIEDSILKVCEELRWHIISQYDLKQFDDVLETCLLAVKINPIFARNNNENDMVRELIGIINQNDFIKNFGYLNREQLKLVENRYREIIENFLKLPPLDKEYFLAEEMVEFSSKSALLVGLLEKEMSEYQKCQFVNRINDFSPFAKSLLLLIICLSVSIPISTLILYRVHIPSTTDRGYTKEEGDFMIKEKKELERKSKELECLIVLQSDKIKTMEQKYEDLFESYIDAVKELGNNQGPKHNVQDS